MAAMLLDAQPDPIEDDGLISLTIGVVIADVAGDEDRPVLDLDGVRVVSSAWTIELRPRGTPIGRPVDARRRHVENGALARTQKLGHTGMGKRGLRYGTRAPCTAIARQNALSAVYAHTLARLVVCVGAEDGQEVAPWQFGHIPFLACAIGAVRSCVEWLRPHATLIVQGYPEAMAHLRQHGVPLPRLWVVGRCSAREDDAAVAQAAESGGKRLQIGIVGQILRGSPREAGIGRPLHEPGALYVAIRECLAPTAAEEHALVGQR